MNTPDPTISVRLEVAHKELCEAVKRQWDGKPAFKISIPARTGYDSDLVIGDALLEAIGIIDALQHSLVQAEQARDEARQERDALNADVHLLKRAISPSRAGNEPWEGMPDITYFVGVALRYREQMGRVRALSVQDSAVADAQCDLLARVKLMISETLYSGQRVTGRELLDSLLAELDALLPDPPPSVPPSQERP